MRKSVQRDPPILESLERRCHFSITLPEGFTDRIFASGLGPETAMDFTPDGRLFVCEQGGTVRVIQNGQLLAAPFLTISSIDPTSERGLLGIAFDPNFAANHFVYVYHTLPAPNLHNQVSRFTADGNVAVAGSETDIFDLDPLDPTHGNHNGGGIHFGPDGKLYIGVGENGTAPNAQSFNTTLGKMLRINADGSIPTDNLFYNQTTGNNRAIWAYGLRNPFTFAFDPQTGRLFIDDVGQNTWEEIDDGIAGSNYGWPASEGPTTDPAFRAPLFAYNHGVNDANGCAITGGTFYHPAQSIFPASYTGGYFFADLCGNWIHFYNPATNQESAFGDGFNTPVDLKVDTQGNLYLLNRGDGSVHEISFSATRPAIAIQPMSQTVNVGQDVSFTVAANGSGTLSYQWQRNGVDIAGATSSFLTVPAVTEAENTAIFHVRINNTVGTVISDAAQLTVLSAQLPVPTIVTPVAGRLFADGQLLTFTGRATDPVDGRLRPAAFAWQVVAFHDGVGTIVQTARAGHASGSFRIPRTDLSTSVLYRVVLTVHDSRGLVVTTVRDLLPRLSTLQLISNVSGARVLFDGQSETTPAQVAAVVGSVHTVDVPSPQTIDGVTYNALHWAMGWTARHSLFVHTVPLRYRARFLKV